MVIFSCCDTLLTKILLIEINILFWYKKNCVMAY